MELLNLYSIDIKYIRDLTKADQHVMSVSPQIGKETRPFVGIVIVMNNKQYCIPITSPKPKFENKSQVDFVKIFDEHSKNSKGAPKVIGILNINNMIPVSENVINKINLSYSPNDDYNTRLRKDLMQKEIRWCRKNIETIHNRANKVYKLVTETPEKNRRLTARCLNFLKLEKVLEKKLGIKQDDISKISEIDRLNWYKAVVYKANAILAQNPKLNAMFQAAKQEYLSKIPKEKHAKPIDENAPISEQIKAAKALKDEYNAIIISNSELKAEYIKAKERYQENCQKEEQLMSHKPISHKTKSHKPHKPKK